MTTEEQLKEFILSKYKSLRNFVNTSGIDIPYTTIDGIFKRGIGNSSVTTIIKLCQTLGISTDELANGNIVPIKKDPITEYAKILSKLSEEKRERAFDYIDYLVTKDNLDLVIESWERSNKT